MILRKKWAFWIWPIFPGYSRNRQESPPTNTATLSWVGSGADGESERGFPALGRGEGLWFWPLGSMELSLIHIYVIRYVAKLDYDTIHYEKMALRYITILMMAFTVPLIFIVFY